MCVYIMAYSNRNLNKSMVFHIILAIGFRRTSSLDVVMLQQTSLKTKGVKSKILVVLRTIRTLSSFIQWLTVCLKSGWPDILMLNTPPIFPSPRQPWDINLTTMWYPSYHSTLTLRCLNERTILDILVVFQISQHLVMKFPWQQPPSLEGWRQLITLALSLHLSSLWWIWWWTSWFRIKL